MRVMNDRFGNPYVLVGMKENKNGYPVAYVELSGKLYRVDISESRNEKYRYWLKVTKVQKNTPKTI